MPDAFRQLLSTIYVKPNAALHLLLEAAATQERRLEAVRCKALLGGPRECL